MGEGNDPGTKLDTEVVGVFADMRYEGFKDEVPIELVRPYEQLAFTLGVSVYIHGARAGADALAVRTRCRQIDATLPVVDMKTLEKQIYHSAGDGTSGRYAERIRSSRHAAGVDRPVRRDGVHGGTEDA